MELVKAAAVALALIAGSPATASEAGRERILVQMPKKLAGAPGARSPDGIVMYRFTGTGGSPMAVGVAVVDREGSVSRAEMRTLTLDMLSDYGVRETIREGTFTTPKWPGAGTFFGEYLSGGGWHQTWTVTTGHEGIMVHAVFLDNADAKRVEALVADKILGGALLSASKPSE